MRRDQIQLPKARQCRDAKIAAAIGTTGAGIQFLPLARGAVRYPGAAAHRAIGKGSARHIIALTVIHGRDLAFGSRDRQILQRRFQLFDLASDLFRGLAEDLFFQRGDAQPSRRIVGKILGRIRHAPDYHRRGRKTIKTKRFSGINQPTRAGGAPQCGLRQSMASHSIASCAEVRRTAPSPRAGQPKRPFRSTL